MSYLPSIIRHGALLGLLGVISIGTVGCELDSPVARTEPAEVAQPAPTSAMTPEAEATLVSQIVNAPNPNNPLIEQLKGEWHSGNPQDPIILFKPNGQVFFVDATQGEATQAEFSPTRLIKDTSTQLSSPSSEGGPIRLALEVEFRLNTTTTPMQADFTLPGSTEPVKAILELTPGGELRIAEALDTSQPRPTSFDEGTVVYSRVSATAELPADAQILPQRSGTGETALAQSPNPEDAKLLMAALNRAQQAYYQEKKQFTPDFKELALGNLEDTEQYKYQVLFQSKRYVVMSATARREKLKSYLAVVLADSSITLPYLCESEANSVETPSPRNIDVIQGFRCPAGMQEVS
jgi:Type IV pilin-like G and H, putative